MEPTIGGTVIYKLRHKDADQINGRRTNGSSIAERLAVYSEAVDPVGAQVYAWPRGAQAHVGSEVKSGDEFPMTIVKVSMDTGLPPAGITINGQVLLDGNDVFWATQISEGDGLGQWHWPEIKK